jgi:hypothetical protein
VVKREAQTTLLLLNPCSLPPWLLTNSLRAALPHIECPYRLKKMRTYFRVAVLFLFLAHGGDNLSSGGGGRHDA